MRRYIKFYMNLLGIKYKRIPIKKYPVGANLCTTIALSKALKKTFDSTFELQVEYGKRSHAIINSARYVVEPILKDNGYERFRDFKPLKSTVGEFMYNHKTGSYVICTKNHIEWYSEGCRYIVVEDRVTTVDLDSWLFHPLLFVYIKKKGKEDNVKEEKELS